MCTFLLGGGSTWQHFEPKLQGSVCIHAEVRILWSAQSYFIVLETVLMNELQYALDALMPIRSVLQSLDCVVSCYRIWWVTWLSVQFKQRQSALRRACMLLMEWLNLEI